MHPQPPSSQEQQPAETLLLSNYPNPFNPDTSIPYQRAKAAERHRGHLCCRREVAMLTLALGHQTAGVYQSKSHAAYWDGQNEQGEHVASGLYSYTLKAGDFTATRKMLIQKSVS